MQLGFRNCGHEAIEGLEKQIEVLVAELAPKPDVPTSIRRLPRPRRRWA